MSRRSHVLFTFRRPLINTKWPIYPFKMRNPILFLALPQGITRKGIFLLYIELNRFDSYCAGHTTTLAEQSNCRSFHADKIKPRKAKRANCPMTPHISKNELLKKSAFTLTKAYSVCTGCKLESCIDDIRIYIPADNRNTPRIDGAREYTSIYHARTHDSL